MTNGYEPPWEPDQDPGLPPHAQNGTGPSRGDHPPSDTDAEQIVLGAALIKPETVDTCARIITAADFYQPAHETLWRTILSLHTAGEPTSSTAVFAALADRGDLRTLAPLGGPTYLNDLEQIAILKPGDPDWYAHRIDQLARRRRAITTLDQQLQRLRRPGPDADVDDVLNNVTDQLTEARLNLANPPTTTTWSPVDLGPVLAGEHLDPPPTMLRRNDGIPLIYEGAVHTVSGESESGKTWLTLIAALQLFQDQRDVTFVDFEDRADRVIGRLLALGAHPDQIRTHFSYIRPDRPLDDGGRAQLTPALAGRALCIIDGVTEAMTMHGFDLNSNADSATFQGLLPRWVADHGPAVVMIDHVVKDKEKQDRFALGAQHKLAGIDGAAYIVKMVQPFARGRRGLAKVEIAKDRPGHVREQAFGRTIAEFTLDASVSDYVLDAVLAPPGAESGRSGQPFEPTILMEKISRFVQLNQGLSKKAIEDVVNGKTATKRLALELLVTRGYIGTKTERNRVLHFHQKPFYPPDKDPGDQTHNTSEAS